MHFLEIEKKRNTGPAIPI